MKLHSISVGALLVAAALLSGCATDTGAYPPVNTTKNNYETTAKVALMGPHVQRSVTCSGVQEGKTDDGRLQIAANLRNMENRRIEVQVQCVFKDIQGFEVDSSPWTTLILTENGQETVHYTALNSAATTYTVRVREAH